MNGFSSGSTDEAHGVNRRVMSEGKDYYERNIKSSDWFAHGNTANPQPEARLRSDAARDNALKNRGSVGESMGGYANPAVERTLHPRGVRPEAQGAASDNKGGNMKNLMENYGNLTIAPKPEPKVKGSEAQEYKEREQGSTKLLLDHYSMEPIGDTEKPPPPRLGHGAGEIADKHKGEQMGPLMRLEGKQTPRSPKQGPLHQTSQGAGWDENPPQVRSRPEGESIAQKNSADSMGEILLQNNVPPPQRKESKVLKHLQVSDMSLQESISLNDIPSEQLKMTYSVLRSQFYGKIGQIPAHRVREDGVQNFEKANNREEMTAIMHGTPTNSVVRPRSGKKVLPHMQKSELW